LQLAHQPTRPIDPPEILKRRQLTGLRHGRNRYEHSPQKFITHRDQSTARRYSLSKLTSPTPLGLTRSPKLLLNTTMKATPLILGLVLAAGSFAYGRHHYVNKNSVSLTNPFNKKQTTTVTSPVVDNKLFGDWMKNEWLFAIAIPAALIAGGVALTLKK
jgi:hypothetical protein